MNLIRKALMLGISFIRVLLCMLSILFAVLACGRKGGNIGIDEKTGTRNLAQLFGEEENYVINQLVSAGLNPCFSIATLTEEGKKERFYTVEDSVCGIEAEVFLWFEETGAEGRSLFIGYKAIADKPGNITTEERERIINLSNSFKKKYKKMYAPDVDKANIDKIGADKPTFFSLYWYKKNDPDVQEAIDFYYDLKNTELIIMEQQISGIILPIN